jgi:hypothetical protein
VACLSSDAPAPPSPSPAFAPLAAAQLLLDFALLGASVLAHSLVLLTQAITLNVAVNSHNNALLALLISSNFAEMKGYVFKRMDAAKVGQLACQDAVERVHLVACLTFVAAQAVENGGANAGGIAPPLRAAAPLILACEVLIDVLKHAFMAKFNDIRPESYSDVLRELARRATRVQAHQAHLVLGFVPMAPAALLLRALPRAAAAAVGAGGGGRRGAAAAAAAAVVAALCVKVICGLLARRLALVLARDTGAQAHPLPPQPPAAGAALPPQQHHQQPPQPPPQQPLKTVSGREFRSNSGGAGGEPFMMPLPTSAVATPRFWGHASPIRAHRKHA